jgi:hypothetical protein
MTSRSQCQFLAALAVLTFGCQETTYVVGVGGIGDASALEAGAQGGMPGSIADSSAPGEPEAGPMLPSADGPVAGASGMDTPGAVPPPPSPVTCAFSSGPAPVRELLTSPATVADRLSKFIAVGVVPGFEPGPWKDTADVERAVREWFGGTEPEHLRYHVIQVVSSFFPTWLGAPPSSNLPMSAFIAGPGGLRVLLTGPAGSPLDTRVGIFSDANVLSTYKRAPRRGLEMRERLFCQPVPAPPADVEIVPLMPGPGTSYRQQMERTVFSEPACAACHRLITSLGFAFENFDDLGRYRTIDNGQPVDASGELVALDDRAVSFNGPRELMEALVGSCAVRECLARKWLAHALGTIGRTLREEDEPSVREVASAFSASGDNLLELVIAITRTTAFLAP